MQRVSGACAESRCLRFEARCIASRVCVRPYVRAVKVHLRLCTFLLLLIVQSIHSHMLISAHFRPCALVVITSLQRRRKFSIAYQRTIFRRLAHLDCSSTVLVSMLHSLIASSSRIRFFSFPTIPPYLPAQFLVIMNCSCRHILFIYSPPAACAA